MPAFRFTQAAVLTAACAAGLPAGATAATIRVPLDQATIAAGLAAATAGDEVVVAAGTWTERDLVLVSDVVLAGETGDPADVLLDAASLGRNGSAVGLGPATEIRGITFRNGSTTTGHGGGFYVKDTDLRITDCRFESCHAGNWGGAIAFQGTSSPVITGCVFSGNDGYYGGGIYCEVGAPVVTECLFLNNHATQGGGGMQAWYPPSCPTLTSCTFAGNRTVAFSGGAFAVQHGTAVLTGCTVSGNRSGGEGAGVFSNMGATLTLDRCILTFQTGLAEPATCANGGTIAVTCSDVFGNSAGDWVGCLAGLETTAGNLAADPLFCDAANGGLSLRANSPCAPAAQSCGLIGAQGVGCQASPVAVGANVRPASWGSVKATWAGR